MTKTLELVTYRLEPTATDSDASVAYVTLNDPDRRNALSDALLDQLSDLLGRAAADPHVRVIVLASSHPRVFSSGGNLDAFADDRPTITKYAGLARFPDLYRTLIGIEKPIVCAADGDVLAGALGIALACDLIIAKESTRLGCPEINIGAFPFMISALIFRATGRLTANELMMTGRLLSATEAATAGLVNRVVPDDQFDDALREWVADIAGKSPLLMGLGKRALAATRDLPLDSALDYLQAQLALAFTTSDLKEGVRAFKEKRPPQWTGA
ncbi:enoyl-CoA hydratase/isomerase family protein [Mycobacterium sp. OTB74]|jgi:enoyl-CoA hydratase/carnithine racemase|uniref:enoyl-CoA hydratase/isomerase family protein n=1 Tax=Mycobacterium sp. OTB74 TaxID=1853452 RepID=UPI002474A5DB|nr:enoyl-CoA hydratase/isomerase family protein [Mycobacterium sp. OTB74]MDH6246438.1 enoyl-CoA hydratase [Mycobacterium sp. OTB74]